MRADDVRGCLVVVMTYLLNLGLTLTVQDAVRQCSKAVQLQGITLQQVVKMVARDGGSKNISAVNEHLGYLRQLGMSYLRPSLK